MIGGPPSAADRQAAFDNGLASVRGGSTCPQSGELSEDTVEALNVIAVEGYSAQREVDARSAFSRQQNGTLVKSTEADIFGLILSMNETGPQGDPAERTP